MQNIGLHINQHNTFGQPTRMTMTGMMDYSYTYNHLNGNLMQRINPFNGTGETFSYDHLNRLRTSSTGNTAYDPNGNIFSKSGLGFYEYDSVRKHAVRNTSDFSGFSIFSEMRFNHNITYNGFGKTQSIVGDFGVMTFIYGPTQQRSRVNLRSGSLNIERFYSLNHERTTAPGLTHIKEYIHSPYGLVATRNIINNGAPAVFPVATDHLGSIVAEHNPHKNYALEFFGYDAWGRRYRFDSPNIGPPSFLWFDQRWLAPNNLVGTLEFFTRGYTGHEHLDFFGLINMNGRMYDPLLGRMLSPDPFVQAPTFTQSFNRYSYVWNNPLKYTDPSGYFVDGYDAWYGWGPGYAGSYGEYAERGGDGWDRYVLDRIIGCPFTRANMQATARGRAGVGGLGIGSWGGRASSGNFAGSSGAWFASQFFWSAAGLQGWNNNGWGGYLIEKSYASFSGDGLRRFFGGIGSWMRSLFPQVVLNDAVSREGINNKNWLHANERNIRRVNERYGTNLWLENGEINWTRGIYIFYTTWINCRKQ